MTSPHDTQRSERAGASKKAKSRWLRERERAWSLIERCVLENAAALIKQQKESK